jgi:hypothetical protein
MVGRPGGDDGEDVAVSDEAAVEDGLVARMP